jgi:hypothetical protein
VGSRLHPRPERVRALPFGKNLEIVNSDRLDRTRLTVDLSDGTFAVFTADQLSHIAPDRQKVVDSHLSDPDKSR